MNTMPELPEPYAWIDAKEMERHKHDGEGGGIICGQYSERYGRESPLYTAAQMHTYALAAIAGREAQGHVEDEVFSTDRIALPHPQPDTKPHVHVETIGRVATDRTVLTAALTKLATMNTTPPPPSDAAQGVRPVRVDAVEGDSGIVAFAMSVTGEMMAALRRFSETAEDDESYDVPKEMMSRLAMFGLVTRGRPGWYYLTDFGRAALAAHKGEGNV